MRETNEVNISISEFSIELFFFFFTNKEATFDEGLGGENFNFSSLHK